MGTQIVLDFYVVLFSLEVKFNWHNKEKYKFWFGFQNYVLYTVRTISKLNTVAW